MTTQFFIALSGGDDALLQACQEALAQVAEVRALDDADEDKDLAAASLLLQVLRPPLLAGVVEVVRLRMARRRLPLLLLSTGVDADVAVELVKCGVADLLSLRGEPQRPDGLALRRKVERILWRRNELTLSDPALEPLHGLFGSGAAAAYAFGASNRRLCYRAHTNAKAVAHLDIRVAQGEVRCQVEDISVATEEQSGGLRVRALPAVAARMPIPTWNRGTELSANFVMVGESEPVPLRLRIIRVEGGSGNVPALLALQYIPLEPRHEHRLQRFWMRCQQR